MTGNQKLTVTEAGVYAFVFLVLIGGLVLANACGPCIGQWKRDDLVPGPNRRREAEGL